MHVIRRTALLLLLGLIFNGLLEFNWSAMRWPGVLQRIALCYFFAALLVMHTKWRTQAIVVVVVLLAYWAVTMLVPAPGFEAGDLILGINGKALDGEETFRRSILDLRGRSRALVVVQRGRGRYHVTIPLS